MCDTIDYLPSTRKMILILYRATTIYRNSSVQSIVRFLQPRVDASCIERELRDEWFNARWWWEKLLTEETKDRLLLEYKFAAKIR